MFLFFQFHFLIKLRQTIADLVKQYQSDKSSEKPARKIPSVPVRVKWTGLINLAGDTVLPVITSLLTQTNGRSHGRGLVLFNNERLSITQWLLEWMQLAGRERRGGWLSVLLCSRCNRLITVLSSPFLRHDLSERRVPATPASPHIN